MNDTIDNLAIQMALKLNKIEEKINSAPPEKSRSCIRRLFLRIFKSKMYRTAKFFNS